jgi:hypothetical protein
MRRIGARFGRRGTGAQRPIDEVVVLTIAGSELSLAFGVAIDPRRVRRSICDLRPVR